MFNSQDQKLKNMETAKIQIVKCEIVKVVASMRKSARFSLDAEVRSTGTASFTHLDIISAKTQLGISSVASFCRNGMALNTDPVLAFLVLRSRLLLSVQTDPTSILDPFLDLLMDGNVDGYVVVAVLQSLELFVTVGILGK